MKKSLLWKIELPNKETSFLFGTMHVRDQRIFSHVDALCDCIKQCEAFATEIDLAGALPDPTIFLIPEYKTLSELYSKRHYDRMRKILIKSFNFDIHHFKQHLPLLIINMLTETTLSEDREVALDKYLSDYALEQGKLMMGVETLEDHLNVLHLIPLEYQLKALKDLSRNVKTFKKNIQQITKYYLKQDISKLYQSSKKSLHGIRSVMLYDRNFKMVDQIEKMALEQSSFIAVGAAHLAGEKGILRLLKKKGFKLSPMPHFGK